MSLLKCPVCGENLMNYSSSYQCKNRHSFDVSKDGYINLLISNKSGDLKGDSKESARARHEFLNKDYYLPLKEYMHSIMNGSVLDICCGEGYYDSGYQGELYGFDISKEMIRLASKSNKNATYFVANLSNIPIQDTSIDTCIHMFAPFHNCFSKVMKDDGYLYSVIPGKDHMIEIKEIVYDTPYENDEKAPEVNSLTLISIDRVKYKKEISKEDAKTLFSMTPYFYRTSQKDKNKLENIGTIEITFDFVILKYEKK